MRIPPSNKMTASATVTTCSTSANDRLPSRGLVHPVDGPRYGNDGLGRVAGSELGALPVPHLPEATVGSEEDQWSTDDVERDGVFLDDHRVDRAELLIRLAP